jgi:myo-inositol 2-dehydrogenase/D-chiro-inositol 1-dehydrogenase
MAVRIGVIGAGIMGAEHARLLSHEVSGSAVGAVYDIDTARAEQVASTVGAEAAADPFELIDDRAVDAVLIASSDATHEQFVLAALAAGKQVLCEKPLAPDVEGCERILAAEQQLGRRLVSVGFMRRYDPAYQLMRETLRDGTIGAPLLIHCAHRNVSSTNQSAAQSISGSAVHEFDIVRWLLDDEIAAIQVHRGRRAASAQCDDPILILVEMSTGVLVDIEVFVNATYGYDVQCELVGETGTTRLDSRSGVSTRTAGHVGHDVPGDWRARFGEAYRRELQHWVDGVTAGGPARGASAWDGYVATVSAQAGVAALASGRATVELIDRPSVSR